MHFGMFSMVVTTNSVSLMQRNGLVQIWNAICIIYETQTKRGTAAVHGPPSAVRELRLQILV